MLYFPLSTVSMACEQNILLNNSSALQTLNSYAQSVHTFAHSVECVNIPEIVNKVSLLRFSFISSQLVTR